MGRSSARRPLRAQGGPALALGADLANARCQLWAHDHAAPALGATTPGAHFGGNNTKRPRPSRENCKHKSCSPAAEHNLRPSPPKGNTFCILNQSRRLAVIREFSTFPVTGIQDGHTIHVEPCKCGDGHKISENARKSNDGAASINGTAGQDQFQRRPLMRAKTSIF